MEDAEEIKNKSAEANAEKAAEKKPESRDEMLSRHRYHCLSVLISFMCLAGAYVSIRTTTVN